MTPVSIPIYEPIVLTRKHFELRMAKFLAGRVPSVPDSIGVKNLWFDGV